MPSTVASPRRPIPSPRRAPALLIALALGLLLSACGGPVQTGDAGGTGATRTSEAAQVTVAVTWDGPAAGARFRVALDTHAVDLDGYDLRQLAVLRTDRGVVVQPSGWDAPTGGHHRSGTLTFPAAAPDGRPVIGPDTRSLELEIRDGDGVPARRFQWQL